MLQFSNSRKIGLLLSVIFTLSNCANSSKDVSNCSDSTTISLGKILNNWVYENKDLNFLFKFPLDWNYLDDRNNMQHSVSTNDIIPYSETLSITLKDLKNAENNKYVLFSLFENSFGKETPKRIVFIVELSKNKNAEKDKQEWITVFEKQTKDVPKELKQKYPLKETTLPFGKNEKLPALEAMGRITGFKNYGCYNLVISVDCFSETDKLEIFKILETIE